MFSAGSNGIVYHPNPTPELGSTLVQQKLKVVR